MTATAAGVWIATWLTVVNVTITTTTTTTTTTISAEEQRQMDDAEWYGHTHP